MQWPLRDGSAFGNQIHVPYEGGELENTEARLLVKYYSRWTVPLSVPTATSGLNIAFCFVFNLLRAVVLTNPFCLLSHWSYYIKCCYKYELSISSSFPTVLLATFLIEHFVVLCFEQEVKLRFILRLVFS